MITVQTRQDFLIELKRLLPYSSNLFGCEIGVLTGEFSKMILDIIVPKELTLIDPYSKGLTEYANGLNTAYSTENDYQNLLDRFDEQIENGQVVVRRKFSYDAIHDIVDGCMDFIYIDSSHIYPDVKKDLNDWLPKLKPDGVMCLHDYADIADFGVIQATDEFMAERNFEKVIFNTFGGDIALKRKNNSILFGGDISELGFSAEKWNKIYNHD